jgi:death on curing protein
MNLPDDNPPLRILSANDLYNINEDVTGYAPFVRDHNLLRSAVRRPFLILFGEEQFPTLLDKAAALLHSLAYHHLFADGNKRTAARATAVFLEMNGIETRWSAAEMQAFVLEVAKGMVETDEISVWLQDHTKTAAPR